MENKDLSEEVGNQIVEDVIYVISRHPNSDVNCYCDDKISLTLVGDAMIVFLGNLDNKVYKPTNVAIEELLDNVVFHAKKVKELGRLVAVYNYRAGKWVNYINKLANDLREKNAKRDEVANTPIDDTELFKDTGI